MKYLFADLKIYASFRVFSKIKIKEISGRSRLGGDESDDVRRHRPPICDALVWNNVAALKDTA